MNPTPNKDILNLSLHITTWIGLGFVGIFILYGFHIGIFSSQEAFVRYVHHFGLWGCAFFIFIQAIQVVVPILPGAIGCAAGVIAFGPLWGFFYNYVGICIGSILAFLIARRYGSSVVRKLVKPKNYDKYIGWLEKGNKFDTMFAIAIASPVAPDDLLCYLAGLTRISFMKFSSIILLGKPLSIAVYSLGLTGLITLFSNW